MVYILIYIKRFCFAVQVKFSNEDKINYHVEFDGNMLIISHNSYISAMQPFVEWKIKSGRNVEIINVAIIGDTTAIKNYVQTYYNNTGLTYLL